jgi:hypothetical protein
MGGALGAAAVASRTGRTSPSMIAHAANFCSCVLPRLVQSLPAALSHASCAAATAARRARGAKQGG